MYFSGYFDLEVFQKHVENETVQITEWVIYVDNLTT